MATPLDTGLLKLLEPVFPLLFVLVISYAVLSRVSIFKENPLYAALTAFILAVMTMFSRVAVRTINTMAPWFVLLFVFAILVLIAYQTFGVEEKTIMDVITGKTAGEYGSTFAHWVLALVLIIGIGSLTKVISEEKGWAKIAAGNATAVVASTEQAGFFAVLSHPKVLGMVLVLLIALFTLQQLASRSYKSA